MNKAILGLTLVLAALPARAGDFSLAFDWGDIPRCTSGFPNEVTNPRFTLSGVPAGTQAITFTLTDLNVPSYAHGGGTVPWRGAAVIPPGVFTYRSPCPPGVRHRYEWRAYALDAAGHALGVATASKVYP